LTILLIDVLLNVFDVKSEQYLKCPSDVT